MFDDYATITPANEREWDAATDTSSALADSDLWQLNASATFAHHLPTAKGWTTTRAARSLRSWANVAWTLLEPSPSPAHSLSIASATTSPRLFLLDKPTDRSPLEHMLAFLKVGLGRDNGDALAARLRELHQDLRDDPGVGDLSMASVLGLVTFLVCNRGVLDPGLVATDSGHVRAEWHRSWDEHFAVEFLPDLRAQFVIFVADANAPGQKARISAMCAVASVMEHALPHGVGSWVLR